MVTAGNPNGHRFAKVPRHKKPETCPDVSGLHRSPGNQHRIGRRPLPAKLADAQRIVPLCKSFPLTIHAQLAVIPVRISKPQRTVKQHLPRRRLQQIGAPHHFRDAHRRIIRNACQLIARRPVAPPDQEISEIYSCREPLRSQIPVHKLDGLAIGNPKPPVQPAGIISRFGCEFENALANSRWTARSRINRLVIWILTARIRPAPRTLMRSAQRRRQIPPRTAAWIDESAFAQPFPRRKINISPFALHIRPELTTHIRPFVPVNSQPAQILKRALCILRSAPVAIEIFHPHYQGAARFSRPPPRRGKRPRMTDMQIACRRRCQPAAILDPALQCGFHVATAPLVRSPKYLGRW
jgi:hypothetical protein